MNAAISRAPSAWAPLLLVALGLGVVSFGCGGGSGSSSGSNGGNNGNGGGDTFDPKTDFYLASASFARPIIDVAGNVVDVVNPASLNEADPITNVPLPGFPKVLEPGTSLSSLAALNFEQIIDPLTPQIPLVPRNAALILNFSKDIDAASLNLSDLDPENPDQLTSASTVQVQRQDGSVVPTRATVDGKSLIIHAIVGDAVGFDASPLVFDSFGNAVEDPTGVLRVVAGVGTGALMSTDDTVLVPRPDKLGSKVKPLPFNPGNSSLDAIVQQTETGVVTFNGFLPDLTAPRIIRAVTAIDTIEAINVTAMGGQAILEITGAELSPPANVVANGGLGEWANARLEVTGVGGVMTPYIVLSNYNTAEAPIKPVFRLVPGSNLDPSVAVGSSFELTRSEFFEPIPPPLPSGAAQLAEVTVDPINHPRDLLDPQDLLNHDLRYFMRVFDSEGSEELDTWNAALGLFQPIPPKSSLQFAFSEPMDVASFQPYENFYVTELSEPKTATAFLNQRVGESRASADSRSIQFTPFLDNQADPEKAEFIGFGGTAASLKLVIRTLPAQADIAALKANATAAQLAQLQDLGLKGVKGVTDLGGRGLGLPGALLDQGNPTQFLLQSSSVGKGPFPPAVDFQVAFQTLPTSDPDYGVIVHRFLGQASSSVFSYPDGSVHDTVESGVEYADYPPEDSNGDGTIDRRFIYGPQLFDIGLTLPGFLTGATAQSIEHLIDNFNKPKASQFASPNGEDVLVKLGFGVRAPLNSAYGCRFQHVYRAGDASPAYNDFNGVILDLVGLAWSPLLLTNTTISDMEILVGLSNAGKGNGPNTNQSEGIPTNGGSGLIDQFDCNLLEWAEVCDNTVVPALQPFAAGQPPLTTVVQAGTPYSIQSGNLFKPSNAANSASNAFNLYLSYPNFNAGIDPVFGKQDVFSFPYDSRFPMLIEYRMKPATGVFPSNNNIYRFSPGILSSALPRFRVWSQGQDPLANCVPNFALGMSTSNGIACGFRAGEGGPLLEPGTFTQPVFPPVPNNGMPIIQPQAYQLPPKVNGQFNQLPAPNAKNGSFPQMGPPILPTCNTDPNTNWYYANGMLLYPLSNTGCFPGPMGVPPLTQYTGYGAAFTGNCPGTLPVNEPSYNCAPGEYGDNSRYYMLWKYRKRVSIIESPTIETTAPAGLVEYARPLIQPPLAGVDPAAGLIVEFRAGTELDFSVPVLESGYVDVTDTDFVEKLSGPNLDRVFVKFRASFAVANGQLQPPFLDAIVIPYRKVSP